MTRRTACSANNDWKAHFHVVEFVTACAAVAYGKGGVAYRWQLANSGYNSSRLGFRGTEDLGGGTSASSWLEAGLANDTGFGVPSNSNHQPSGTGAATTGLVFNRRSTVARQ